LQNLFYSEVEADSNSLSKMREVCGKYTVRTDTKTTCSVSFRKAYGQSFEANIKVLYNCLE